MRFGDWLDRLRGVPRAAADPEPQTDASPRAHSAEALSVLQRAHTLLERGAWTEAQAAYEQALRVDHALGAAHLGLGRLHLQQDRIEDALDCLQLACVFDPDCARAHAELALGLTRQGAFAAARASAERAVALAAEDVEAWVACARANKALNDTMSAARCYERALSLRPGSAELAAQLGYVRFLGGHYQSAQQAYADALAAEPNHVPALHNRGLLALETGDAQEALALFERAVALQASPQSLTCVGHALRDLGRIDEACVVYRRVLETYPAFGDARINLSYALLMRGDFSAGWAEYECRFDATGTETRDFGLPWWQGESLAGRRVLVVAEQGLGDEIMFASCLPQLIASAESCVIECNTRLAALFARSFPTARVHGAEKNADRRWLAGLPRCDYQVAIGSLPRAFRSSAAAFGDAPAYLVADPQRVASWRQRIGASAALNIGFAWRGGALRTRQWLRSIPLAACGPLLETQGVRFFALQHGDHAPELAEVVRSTGVALTDLSAACADLDELAAVVAALDLIISVDNTLVHLAGALGKPTWALLPSAPEWRYLRAGARVPWYGCVRLFRQQAARDWAPVIDDVAAALAGAAP